MTQCSPDSVVLASAGAFSTFPHESVADSYMLCLWDQIFGTFLLLFGINALNAKSSPLKVSGQFAPLMVGLLVCVIGQTYCVNFGYAINPARDFGPRLYTYLAGWDNVFGCQTLFWTV